MKRLRQDKRILLVQPSYKEQRRKGAWGVNPPLGIAYIAAVLEEAGVGVEVLDANALDLAPVEVSNYIKNGGYEVVGFSILTPAHDYCTDVAKRLPPGILKIAGGNQADALYEDFLAAGFDVCVLGEGEHTMLELAQGKELSEVKGIAYRDGDQVVTTERRHFINPDEIPFPARHLLPGNGVNLPYRSAYTQFFPWTGIFTSRGCPYDCNFCFKSTFGYKFRPRSVENVIAEIDFLKKTYALNELDFYDDVFNFDLGRAEAILDAIIQRNFNIHLRCTNGLRADKITERFVSKLKKAGCCYVAFGIESGDQGILNMIPKKETLEEIERAVALTKKAGITTCGFFIFGLLGDTSETMQRTLDFAKQLRLDVASFTIATPYPGTKLWEAIKKEGQLFFSNWSDFHHSSGKMLFAHPMAPSAREVEMMFKRSYGVFYYRIAYILRNLFRIRSLGQLRIMVHGLKSILRTRRLVV